MRTMKMMDHIVVHSLQVCRVATFLSGHLNQPDCRLDHDLVQSAALLHDITKTRSFKTGENHARTGGAYLRDCGYPEIGELVRQHVQLDEYPAAGPVSEVQVLNYADKRVLHDEIVVLDRRLDYILERYGQTPAHRERINLLWEKTRQIESRLFRDLTFAPGDLARLLPHNGYSIELRRYQKSAARIRSGK